MVQLTTVKFQAAAKYLACAKYLTILTIVGRYSTGGESAHKSWALGNHSSLGDYMFEIQHQRGGERAHQRDQGEVSSCRFC
jgi:hypothetical protein